MDKMDKELKNLLKMVTQTVFPISSAVISRMRKKKTSLKQPPRNKPPTGNPRKAINRKKSRKKAYKAKKQQYI